MANNIISQKDKAKMFDYLKDYQDYIKPNFGNYDYLDQESHKFISTNDIYLGSCSKKCKRKLPNINILFYLSKPSQKIRTMMSSIIYCDTLEMQ